MNDQTGLSDRFQKLRQEFVERCRNEASILTAIGDQKAIDAKRAETLMRIAHSLAGAGGTFGFPDISTAASTLEELLASDGAAGKPQTRAALQALITMLGRAASS